MPKKKDPRAALIRYFMTAEFADAQAMLDTVKEIVRSRQPLYGAPGKKKTAPALAAAAKSKTAPVADAVPTV